VVGSHSDNSQPAVRAEGWIQTTDVGLYVYRTSEQNVGNSTEPTVIFNGEERDHFDGYDPTDGSGTYTVQRPGDYHVDVTISWKTGFASGDKIIYRLYRNSNTIGGIRLSKFAAGGAPSHHFGRTLFDLAPDDEIEVTVEQNSSSQQTIANGQPRTDMTIHKVG